MDTEKNKLERTQLTSQLEDNNQRNAEILKKKTLNYTLVQNQNEELDNYLKSLVYLEGKKKEEENEKYRLGELKSDFNQLEHKYAIKLSRADKENAKKSKLLNKVLDEKFKIADLEEQTKNKLNLINKIFL